MIRVSYQISMVRVIFVSIIFSALSLELKRRIHALTGLVPQDHMASARTTPCMTIIKRVMHSTR